MPKTIKTTTLRDNLAEALKQAKNDDYLIITKNNEPVTALVDIDYFEDLMAATNPKFLASLEEARQQIANGEVYTLDEVMKDLD